MRSRRSRASAAGIWFALVATLTGCGRGTGTGVPTGVRDGGVEAAVTKGAGNSASPTTLDKAINSAVDRRDVKALSEVAPSSAALATLPQAVRRLYARGVARVADDSSSATLMDLLSDEDDEVVAWAAYGLGYTCKAHEEAHVRALVARAVTWSSRDTSASPARRELVVDADASRVDPAFALARAIGRCATPAAEQTLSHWVKARNVFAEPAAYALGDLVTRKGSLTDETVTTLLDAAAPSSPAARPMSQALQPFTRMTAVGETFRARVIDAARGNLAVPGPERIFAVRALAKAMAPEAVLGNIVADRKFSVAERVEAARGLSLLAVRGRRMAADVLTRLGAARDEVSTSLGTAEVHVLYALLDVLRDNPAGADKVLYTLSALSVPEGKGDALVRRAYELRCRAAAVLARGEFDAEVLTSCAPEPSEARERVRLKAVLQGPLTGARRVAFLKLARSKHVRVREAALEALGSHPEIGIALRPAVAEALASKMPGLVATAAELIRAQPRRFADADGKPLSPEVDVAFLAAASEAWAEDLVETKLALVDAAVATNHARAKELAQVACRDANVTMRQRGAKAIATLGAPASLCDMRETSEPSPVNELVAARDRRVKISFQVAGASVAIVLDSSLAPVTAARLEALARAGFFRGIVVHRVVPGFVVQLGDPGGDGYGGGGKLLRCETSPVRFAPLDVGMALAGRDTGSSQFFVTLSATPHLDGDYTHVGRATGDWANLIEGDVIDEVQVSSE